MEYWVIICELHDADLIIFVIHFTNSSDDTGLMWYKSNIFDVTTSSSGTRKCIYMARIK